MDEFARWVEEERARTGTDGHGQTRTEAGTALSVSVGAGPWKSVSASELAANGALSLLNVCCYLLDRQLAAQAAAFEREGGFTERLFRVRSEVRRGH
jgi:four helix bundle suffix protein